MSYGNLSSLIYSLFLIVSLWGVGILILKLSSFRFNGILEEGLFAIGIGYVLITNILFFLGLFNLINYGSVLAVFIIAVLLALYVLYSFFIKSKPFSYTIYRPNYYEFLMIGLLLILFITNIIGSLAPPTLGDSMNHHLSAPKYYGKIGGFPFIPISPWPAPGLMHVLYTQTMILSNGVVCQVISCLFGVATMLAVFAITRHYFGSFTGLISSVIFYSLPITTELSTGGMVEFGASFCIVLSLWALIKSGPEFDTRWVILSGIIGGCAGATKLWALMSGPAFIMIILLLFKKSFFQKPLEFFRIIMIYSFSFGLILLPWFIRNYITSGNPLWPIGYSIFNTQYWSEISVLKYGNWTRGPGTSLWYYISGPWHLTNNIAEYNAGYGIFTSYLLNPLILIFIPCTILYFKEFNKKAKRLLLALMVCSFTVYTIWFLGGYHHPRYLQIIHPFLCILAGLGVTTFLEKLNSFKKRIIAVLFTFISMFFLSVSLLLNIKYFPVVSGYTSSEKYLEDNLPNFTGVQWLNKNLPENSKVLYAGTSAWYYMEKDYIPLSLRSINYANIRTPQGLANKLKEFGITHIYIESDDLKNAKLSKWRKNELKNYSLNSLSLCQEWLDLGAEGTEIGITTYHEIRPFILMRGMELSGDLSLLSLIKTKLITSRTKGTSIESEASVYAFE